MTLFKLPTRDAVRCEFLNPIGKVNDQRDVSALSDDQKDA